MSILNNILFFNGSILMKTPSLVKLLLNYKSDSLRIVYYHIVTEKNQPYYFDNKSITPKEFECQINFLKKHYEIISLSEAMLYAKEKKSLKKKLVLTFDDGFTENHTVIAPILSKNNLSAVFYLMSNCIDNKDMMWRNKLLLINKVDRNNLDNGIKLISKKYKLETKRSRNLMEWSFKYFPMDVKDEIVNLLWKLTLDIGVEEYLEKNEPYLTSKQIVELNSQGFEFGSHSMSHPIFSKLTYQEFEHEIVNSKIEIEKIIKKNISSFSYPFGNRAPLNFEEKFLSDNPNSIDMFLGTKSKLKNTNRTISSWERDNLEFSNEIALSRFLIVPAIRAILN